MSTKRGTIFYVGGWPTPRALGMVLNLELAPNNKPYARDLPKPYINWGVGSPVPQGDILNEPGAILKCVNKLTTFQTLAAAHVPTVAFTTDPAEAQRWYDGGSSVMGREQQEGREGAGIVFLHEGERKRVRDFPHVRLWTRFFPCDYEARYHVFNREILDVQRKRRIGADAFNRLPQANRDLSFWIRTHANGWYYSRRYVEIVDHAARASIGAVSALGLDFGTVDIRITPRASAILEVNSAPGLIEQPGVFGKYAERLDDYIREASG